MSANSPLLLIVDYNLTRISDVAHIAAYARRQHGAQSILIRSNPSERDAQLCDHLIDLDPLAAGFVDAALTQLRPWRDRLRAGVVFSDNAVQRGAELLERLGLPTDSAELAIGAFSKHAYRIREAALRDLLEPQSVWVPDCVDIRTIGDLRRFAAAHPNGFVVKPSCEGNNRGVVIVKAGDNLDKAFAAVEPYLQNGAICEALIPFEREFSFDGVGTTEFITEKLSARGRYPVEVAQILPARLGHAERATLTRVGRLANLLVGQRRGPFHNEIKLADDGLRAAVVEPNRRPAGMKIWTIAEIVYGIDFYALWVDAAFGSPREPVVAPSTRQAATVMLGVPADVTFCPPDELCGIALFERVLAQVSQAFGVDSLRRLEFAWLSARTRFIPAVPRDNADFAAQACIALDNDAVEMRDVVSAVRQTWLSAIATVLSDADAIRESDATHPSSAAA